MQIRHGVVEGRRISLAVRGESSRGFLLERRSRGEGEPLSTQRIGACDAAAIAAFVEHDPYRLQLVNEYRAVLAALDPYPASAVRSAPPRFASECDDEGLLIDLMRRVCATYGATHCFFHLFFVDEDSGDVAAHDLLVGGAPAWAQRYVHEHWHINDPAAAHARDDTWPLRAASLSALPFDHWLKRQAPAHGLNGSVFFPAHRRDVPAFGVLHVDAPQGDETLWQNRRLLRGLADELLEWQVTQRRRQLAGSLSLGAQEVLALSLVARGGGARHVAEELMLGERAVYQLFTAINRKMNCEHIKISANKARHLGLLSEGYIYS